MWLSNHVSATVAFDLWKCGYGLLIYYTILCRSGCISTPCTQLWFCSAGSHSIFPVAISTKNVECICRNQFIIWQVVTGEFPTQRSSNADIVSIWWCHNYDVIKWKHFPCYWPFVRGIHRSPHKDHWRGALMLSLIYAWINGWVNIREAGNLRRHRAHYDSIVKFTYYLLVYN